LIDLHCHVLPGDDDGPADEAESAELLLALASDGVDVAAVTPYVPAGASKDVGAEIRDRVAELRKSTRGPGVPALIPGAELELGWALSATEEQLRSVTYGHLGNTLLVRSPYRGTTEDFDDILLNLTLRGFRVLLAHPECNRAYQDQPMRLGRLVHHGVLIQVNAGSLLAEEGSRARRMALALLQEDAAHVIASNARALRPSPPRLADAVRAAEAVCGPRARWMVSDVPAAILGAADLPPAPRGTAPRRGLLGRWRSAG
jgi:protein-tyrosine phosphatase